MKAKITFILQVDGNDPEAVAEMMEIKRQIESGDFQRGMRKTGVRKAIATFEYMER